MAELDSESAVFFTDRQHSNRAPGARADAAIGICVGASTIGMVRVHVGASGPQITWARSEAHEGDPESRLKAMLDAAEGVAGLRVAVTGRKFRERLAFATISEPEAVERAMAHVFAPGHPYRVVVSAGGETFMAYHLDNAGRIQAVYTGNKCAAGTGEFFLQQLRRMNVTLDEVAEMSLPEHPHKVSGRCSVFCKSDCTHALNKGIPKPEVVAGLSMMMAGKILELLARLPKTSVVLIGGAAANRSMVAYLRREIEDLHIPMAAPYFEALGAAIWALEHETPPLNLGDAFFRNGVSGFSFLRPLSEFRDRVCFKEHPRGVAAPGDRVIVGLDVGSTTTKGVVMRRSDKAILASEYLRTNGDPVGASRRVYRALADQISVPIEIEGLGVTGSGRQIAGLHAMTDGIINEIIAHATAAVHFDPNVDTIFEIGGQDAKYTCLTNSVPSDYAMNEACSAGTGSFLEESAKESLCLDVTAIADMAYAGRRPPNFNDQCAAFISSDIKIAVQEGIPVPDIVAGLVYSICMNYLNRVKGNRPVGGTVFMQGGVCYNRAVPAAMAALVGGAIVVPPEPGLMGAFGVALEVEHRMERGLLAPRRFDLEALAAREALRRDPFVCAGGAEHCDRKCLIARIEIDGKVYPFGGICNRFDNLVHHRTVNTAGLNLVVERQRRVFAEMAADTGEENRPTVGMNRSFLTNTYFPLFNRFFRDLGFRLVVPSEINPAGTDRQGAAFCYPVELAHGFAAALVAMRPDYIFLPHIRGIPSDSGRENSCTCVFVQGEPYYLRTAFPELDSAQTLSPYFDFTGGFAAGKEAFRELAAALGVDSRRFDQAFQSAVAAQERFQSELATLGKQALATLRRDPEAMAIVLFGRAYNSFAPEANKGIPNKFATRGLLILPHDMLPAENEQLDEEHNMYWGTGRMILRAAQYVARHPQLFGVYISNFSCGPDSFLTGYFREIMGRKPSLTLELDSHTADAGLETRIEAFLDVVACYRQRGTMTPSPGDNGFRPALIEYRGRTAGVRTSGGEWLPLQHPRVKVLLPAMSRYGTVFLAKAFARSGVRAEVLPPANEEALKLGRANSTCKECLPLQTTIGSLMRYLKTREPGEVTAYFMPSTDGPCRFGQYHVFSKKMIRKQCIEDLAVLSLTTANGYGGLGERFALNAWRAIVTGDLFDEIWATILAGAVDPQAGLRVFEEEHQAILDAIGLSWPAFLKRVAASARRLGAIELKRPYAEMPKISLVGEIYVRNDPISLQNLVERLAEKGFIVRTSKTGEWIKYLDWLTRNNIESDARGLGFWIRHWLKGYMDAAVRKRLRACNLFFWEEANVAPVMEAGGRFISPRLTGEAILTVGSALHEMMHPSCGVILIGPFGCMPSRVAESILGERLTAESVRAIHNSDMPFNGKSPLPNEFLNMLPPNQKLPFLAIETDGNLFPQLIEARLEAFMLQARRLNDRMLQHFTKT